MQFVDIKVNDLDSGAMNARRQPYLLVRNPTNMVEQRKKPRDPDHESESELPARLGRNLAARRKALGLTQADVAERLGVDTETLSRFERGKHVPSLLTLERLAQTLASTCADLLSETPQLPSSDALTMEIWLAGLGKKDAAFVKRVLKVCCDHLANPKAR